MSSAISAPRIDLGRLQWGALGIGVAALVVCVIGALFSPVAFFGAYLVAYLLCLGIALGVAVGVGLAVGLGVAVGVTVGVAVGVGEGVEPL